MRKKLLIQRTLRSLMKYGAFLIVIMAVVFSCSDDNLDAPIENETTANLTVKTDGAIMGSVIAPNAEVLIMAKNSNETIKGTTDENGEFFITGFSEGTYDITISTDQVDKTQTFEDVEVVIGEVTDVGTVTLAQQ